MHAAWTFGDMSGGHQVLESQPERRDTRRGTEGTWRPEAIPAWLLLSFSHREELGEHTRSEPFVTRSSRSCGFSALRCLLLPMYWAGCYYVCVSPTPISSVGSIFDSLRHSAVDLQ